MELYEEKKVEKKKDISKIVKISLIVALALLIIFIIILLVMPEKQVERKVTLTLDGKAVAIPDAFCIINQSTGDPFFSLKDLANVLGYPYYRGEYLDRYTEDSTKCYIESEQEISSYILGSNVIYKAAVGATGRYEYYNITDSIVVKDSKLYTNLEGIKIGLNLMASYNSETKVISIQTLKYVTNKVKTQLAEKKEYTLNETNFNNRKAVLYDLYVVNKDGKVGVINKKGETVIGTKYSSIQFSENTREFFVKSDNKSGVLSLGGETKIALTYDDIQWLDTDNRLYYVKKDKYYGVLDRNGKISIHIEYDQIGIDSTLYPKNKIKNKMFLYDNCIPVKKNNKWGFFDKNGKLIIPLVYDKIGYIASTSNIKSSNNVLLIEDIDGIVVGITVDKASRYGVVNSLGEILIPCEYDKIYSITSGAEDTYYLEKDGQTVTMDQYVLDHNLRSYKNNTLIKTNQNQTVELNGDNNTDTINSNNDISNVVGTNTAIDAL